MNHHGITSSDYKHDLPNISPSLSPSRKKAGKNTTSCVTAENSKTIWTHWSPNCRKLTLTIIKYLALMKLATVLFGMKSEESRLWKANKFPVIQWCCFQKKYMLGELLEWRTSRHHYWMPSFKLKHLVSMVK